MVVTAVALPPVLELDEAEVAGEDGAGEEADALEDDPGADVLLELPLLHAAAVRASADINAAARKIRRPRSLNRTTPLLSPGQTYCRNAAF
jgi:hypothetical protein